MEPIGPEVRRELRRFGGAEGMSDIVTAWPKAVGETVAANAWPARLARDETLHVNAASSTLEQARAAHDLAAPIASEELRKSVEKAARMSLAAAADDRRVW
jgi:hypothetical protein